MPQKRVGLVGLVSSSSLQCEFVPLVSSWPHSARLFVGFLAAVSLGFLCGWASLQGECDVLVFFPQDCCAGGPLC